MQHNEVPKKSNRPQENLSTYDVFNGYSHALILPKESTNNAVKLQSHNSPPTTTILNLFHNQNTSVSQARLWISGIRMRENHDIWIRSNSNSGYCIAAIIDSLTSAHRQISSITQNSNAQFHIWFVCRRLAKKKTTKDASTVPKRSRNFIMHFYSNGCRNHLTALKMQSMNQPCHVFYPKMNMCRSMNSKSGVSTKQLYFD